MLICQAPAQRLPMTAQWLPAVAALDAQAQRHPWSLRQFTDSLQAGYHGEVLVRHGELLGFYMAMQAVDEGHLLCISVAPAQQGQGYGQCLLAALQEWADGLQLQSLWLEVRASNSRAHSLYLHHGFIEAGRRKHYYAAQPAGREDAVVMCKILCT